MSLRSWMADLWWLWRVRRSICRAETLGVRIDLCRLRIWLLEQGP